MKQLDGKTKTIDVVILVSLEYSLNHHPDDLALQETLIARGYTVEIVAWDNRSYDFSQVKLAIIRSCWDYDERLEEFLIAMAKIEEKCILLNSWEMIRGNSNKYYLQDLKAKGIPIVPTVFIKDSAQILSALNNFTTEQIVVKPVISASGRNTYRFHRTERELITEKVEELLKFKDVMIQPYLNTIESKGEKSTVVIDGQIVYTMLKKPAAGNFLVHTHRGGKYVKDQADIKDQSFIRQVLDALPELPLYLRIDYLFDSAGNPLLLELELIEPNLYLAVNELGLQLLTDRLIAMLRLNKSLQST